MCTWRNNLISVTNFQRIQLKFRQKTFLYCKFLRKIQRFINKLGNKHEIYLHCRIAVALLSVRVKSNFLFFVQSTFSAIVRACGIHKLKPKKFTNALYLLCIQKFRLYTL